jgi:rubredoxin
MGWVGVLMEKAFTCPMCGHSFDPTQNQICPTCPLNKGCSLICCPECGFENIDVSRSRLAMFIARLFPNPTNRFRDPSKTDLLDEEP